MSQVTSDNSTFFQSVQLKQKSQLLEILKQKMFRFFMSSQQRKLISELQELDLFTDELPLKLSDYQLYFRQLVVIEPDLTKHLNLLLKQKHTPIIHVKILVFIHVWLQATCIIEDPQPVLDFINTLFKEIENAADKLRKNRKKSELKMSKSEVLNISEIRFQQLEWSKELFLLEEVIKPYLYYLQKLISIFEFYNSLKKNFIKPMNQSEVWVLVNLFHNIEKITNNIPPICKFIRKSYRPVAEALALMFSQDIANFYPKLYKYCYGEANKVKSQFLELENQKGQEFAYRKTVEGIDGMINLLAEIGKINRALKVLYQEPTIHNLESIYIPKIIDIQGHEFLFIIHLNKIKQKHRKASLVGDKLTLKDFHEFMTTPKFRTIEAQSRSSQGTEEDDCQNNPRDRIGTIFRDITNDDDSIATFRKDEFNFKGAFKKNYKQSEGDEPKIANSYDFEVNQEMK